MSSKISVWPTEQKGRGVFATEEIAKEEIIEVCPVIVLNTEDRERLNHTALYNYYFGWGLGYTGAAIALGYGSLYNHSFTPNAQYLKQLDTEELHIVARETIHAGEEITVNYNEDPADHSPIWFKPLP